MELKAGRKVSLYISQFILTIMCLGLGTLILWVATVQESFDYAMAFFSLIFYALGIYSVTGYMKKMPVVRFSDEGIRFSGKWYSWSQVKSVDFTAQKPLKFLWSGKYMKAVTLTFDDGKELYLFDQAHSNMKAVRIYLQSRIAGELHVPEVKGEELTPEEQKEIKRKTRWFGVIFIVSALAMSFGVVFLELSDGMMAVVVILYNVAIIALFLKMFRKKKMDGQGQ